MKKALITGITGQDGAYLAKFLLEKNYEVHGIRRRSSLDDSHRRIAALCGGCANFEEHLVLHYGDITDTGNLIGLVAKIQPDEIYNLAAQSHVKVSFELPEYTADANALGTLRILEAIRILGMNKKTKFYQASSSELFGKAQQVPQRETTPFYPRSPYAAAKLFAYWITVNYRESYGIFACNGILFNHESPFRGEYFVTRKISRAVARIKLGLQEKLVLGNLNAERDWGFAGDYVKAMWMMLQKPSPGDYIVGTGKTCSVRNFVETAFACAGIKIVWLGNGLGEIGIDAQTERKLVEVSPQYFRPAEVDVLMADITKTKELLGWSPAISLDELAEMMVKNDLALAQKELSAAIQRK